MKSYLFILVVAALLYGVVGWDDLQKPLALMIVPAIFVTGFVYLAQMNVFRSFRSAIASFFLKMPMLLGFSLLFALSVGLIALMVFSSRDFASPSESWLFVTLGFLAGLMGSVARLKKSKIKSKKRVRLRQGDDGHVVDF